MGKRFEKDALGTRMKAYEAVTRFTLPRRTYSIIRVDGRAFHTFTKGLTRPYDLHFMILMDATALALCSEIAGSQFAFVQSDEISILVTDFTDIKTEAWFDGVVQKWASVAMLALTAAFNLKLMEMQAPNSTAAELKIAKKIPKATFDSRVFLVPDFVEVENYFVWRQKDAIRNSITMLAQAYASHRMLQGKNQSQQHEIIHAAGDNWANHPNAFKNGRIIRKSITTDWVNEAPQVIPELRMRTNWLVDLQTPVFTQDRKFIRDLIPIPWENDVVRRVAAGE